MTFQLVPNHDHYSYQRVIFLFLKIPSDDVYPNSSPQPLMSMNGFINSAQESKSL